MWLRWCARLGVLAVALLVSLLVPAAVATAHPLGLPAFARVVATSPTDVVVAWTAAPDDVAALARSLGLPDVGGALTREQDTALAQGEELASYVADRLEVRQDAVACPARLSAGESVVASGLTIVATCPEPVDVVDVRITLLHDLDERYRTLAAAAGPDGVTRAMFTVTEPEHEMAVSPDAAGLLPATAFADSATDDVRGAFGGALPLERQFVTAVDGTVGLGSALVAVAVALGVGAVHALAPGHGKAVAAAYLVGDRGRVRDAVVLGAAVALMHTGSVLVLGLALWSAASRPDAARLTDALQLVTGVLFAALGAWLLVRRTRDRRTAHDHQHTAPAPLSRQGVVALGAAGGLLPSPSALLVLLTALAVGRLALGLTLIAAFSLGWPRP
ncbi:MAG: hypothetical protein ACLGIG_08540 [Actinomycetes bacterium]